MFPTSEQIRGESVIAITTMQKSVVDLAQYGEKADVEKDLLLEKVNR